MNLVGQREISSSQTGSGRTGDDSLLPQHHESHQQQRAHAAHAHEASGVLSFGIGGPLQTQQPPVASHPSIPPIPEDHSTAGVAKGNLDAIGGDSGTEISSATTSATATTTPNSASSAGEPGKMHDHRDAPDFPNEGIEASASSILRGRDQGSSHGEASWQASLSRTMMSTTFDPTAPSSGNSEVPAYTESQGGQSHYSHAFYPSAIKLLVSNNVAGSIIGRAGQTISELQAQSNTRIKLSQTGDYYPGTQDRVCLVQGQLDNVKTALSLLLKRLYMLQEHQHSQHMAWQSNRHEGPPSFDFVVRLLVPSSSCGMIIGKSGSNIRHMEEVSGVSSVRLSPKEAGDPNYPSASIVSSTSERVVALTGPTLESCLNCLFIILDGMTSHPDICRYSNMTTSYSRIISDQYAGNQSLRVVQQTSQQTSPESPLWEAASPHFSQAQGLGRRVSSSPDLAGVLLNQRVAMPPESRATPASPHIGREAVAYNPLFGGPTSTYSQIQPQGTQRVHSSTSSQPLYLSHMDSTQSTAGVSSSVSAPDLLALQLQEAMHITSQQQPHPPPPSEYPLFASPLPQATAPQTGFTAQVLVPDNMIGSILGRGGRTLNELQLHSGTRIRISQRGEYLPGTRNRIVTIRGPTSQSVSLAQYMMSQRMILPRTAAYQQQQQIRKQHMHPQHQEQDQHTHQHDPSQAQQQTQMQQISAEDSNTSTNSSANQNSNTADHQPS